MLETKKVVFFDSQCIIGLAIGYDDDDDDNDAVKPLIGWWQNKTKMCSAILPLRVVRRCT